LLRIGNVLSVDFVTHFHENSQDTLLSETSNRGLGRLARSLLPAPARFVGLFWLTVAVVGIALVGPIAGRLTSTTAFRGCRATRPVWAITVPTTTVAIPVRPFVVVTLPADERAAEREGNAALQTTFATLSAEHFLRVRCPTRRYTIHVLYRRAAVPSSDWFYGGNNSPTSAPRFAAQLRTAARRESR